LSWGIEEQSPVDNQQEHSVITLGSQPERQFLEERIRQFHGLFITNEILSDPA
jgi:hypothetical protein